MEEKRFVLMSGQLFLNSYSGWGSRSAAKTMTLQEAEAEKSRHGKSWDEVKIVPA